MQQINHHQGSGKEWKDNATPDTSISENNSNDNQLSQDGSWSAFVIAASFMLLIVTLSLIFYALSQHSEINKKGLVINEQ